MINIKYDLKKKYLQYYDEANGVVALKKRILKNPKIKLKSYLELANINTIISLIFLVILAIFAREYNSIWGVRIIYFLLGVILLNYFYMIYSFIIGYKSNFNSKSGLFKLTETSIIDQSDNGNYLEIGYDSFDLIVITKNLIVFTGPNSIMFFIENTKKDEIKKFLEKNNIDIIDKS